MHRFIVNLPDEVFEELREKAFKRKVSISKLSVSYIEEKLKEDKPKPDHEED